jgi:hypothetical protein
MVKRLDNLLAQELTNSEFAAFFALKTEQLNQTIARIKTRKNV